MFDNLFENIAYVLANYYQKIFAGLLVTLQIAFFAVIIGLVIGSLIAIVRVMPKDNIVTKIINGICSGYLMLFRGTPIVVQLLLFYFGFFVVLGVQPMIVAIIVFGMNSGAYIAEIMRSAILSVDKGQLEASRSLGLSYTYSMGKVVLPQAIKNAVPNLGNEFITLLKETSVASFILVIDLAETLRLISYSSYKTLASYIILAVIYLIIVGIFTYILRLIERRLRKSDKR